jgi:hypothetical protein
MEDGLLDKAGRELARHTYSTMLMRGSLLCGDREAAQDYLRQYGSTGTAEASKLVKLYLSILHSRSYRLGNFMRQMVFGWRCPPDDHRANSLNGKESRQV